MEREALDRGRDTAIACIEAARNYWIGTSIARAWLTLEGELDQDTSDRLAAGEHEITTLIEQWQAQAGGSVLESVERANAGSLEPVQACGSTFATAWEAARHCAQVVQRLSEDREQLWQMLESDETRATVRGVTDADHAALVARVKAEHARAVAELNAEAGEPDNWISGKEAAGIIGFTPANVGRKAGPEGSDMPILDNGKAGTERKYYRPSVDEFARRRNQRTREQEHAPPNETWAEVEQKTRDIPE